MKHFAILITMVLIPLYLIGCRAEVKPSNDSTKIEVEVPKVEIKNAPDLDPRTDHDVDIKTPTSNNK